LLLWLPTNQLVVKVSQQSYAWPMKSPRPVRQIGLRLTPELFAWLEAMAKAEDRTLPYLVKRILKAEMEREAGRQKRNTAA
jgi:hypothetical protein